MPDYIQLLESKLSPTQKQALNAITDIARARGITVFLTGGAVRDIVSGASVRDLDITVQGNPFKFKKDLEKAGFSITGSHEPSQTLYLRYNGRARLEISAARTETFSKPGRPEVRPAAILDDLRRRDFTANAMALSLNEGSWGLMLDPLNGTADIISRHLRLVSNYGFLEDPIRMVRAIRFLSRTGWEMDERTKARYDNARSEGVISAISAVQRGYELEEIVYEEEPLQAMKALESEGWLEHLSPNWTSRSADAAGLERLHDKLVQLLMAGLQPDASAAQFRLLTAKLSSTHLSALKRLFVRSDLIEKADSLERQGKKVLQQITAKDSAKPSHLWKLLHRVDPEAALWLFFTGKTAAIQNRFESFFKKWPEARQKIPNAILLDMRITPDVSGYEELLDKLTFAFMDDELPNEEAIRKLAEPYSPPAPPPPVVVRRSRAVKRVVEPKGSRKGKKSPKPAESPTDVAASANGAAASGVSVAVAAASEKSGGKSAARPAVAKTGAPPQIAAKKASPEKPQKAAAKVAETRSKAAATHSAKSRDAKSEKKDKSKKSAKPEKKPTARKTATVHKPAAKKVVSSKPPNKVKAASKSIAKGKPAKNSTSRPKPKLPAKKKSRK